MNALTSLQGLFGLSGYRAYAMALGRGHTTFHANVSNPATVTSRLVALSCALIEQASQQGERPHALLQTSAQVIYPDLYGRNGLELALESVLGEGALQTLGDTLGMSLRAVQNAVVRREARYNPHFRLIAVTLIALQKRGAEPVLPDLMADLAEPDLADLPADLTSDAA